MQGFFGEWRRRGRGGRAAEFAVRGTGPHAGAVLGAPAAQTASRACAAGAQTAPCPGPAAGASHLPDSRSAGGQGYAARSWRSAVIDGCAPLPGSAGARAGAGAGAPRAAELGEVLGPARGPAAMGRRTSTLPGEACRKFQNFRCAGGVLARWPQKLALTTITHILPFRDKISC